SYPMYALSLHDALPIFLYSVLLLAVSAFVGWWAVAAAVVLLAMSVAFAAQRTPRNARRLFMTSNVYLLAAMALLATSCGHQSDRSEEHTSELQSHLNLV